MPKKTGLVAQFLKIPYCRSRMALVLLRDSKKVHVIPAKAGIQKKHLK
ncbi:hypothetical protein [Rickettsia endosymbiont of Polydrusus tereticollis]